MTLQYVLDLVKIKLVGQNPYSQTYEYLKPAQNVSFRTGRPR